MEIKDLFKGYNIAFRNSEPTFQTRLLYAKLASPYGCYCDSKWGYLDGANKCIEAHKPIEEIEKYIYKYEMDNSPLNEYDTAYVQACKDYIKQEQKARVTNE